MSLRCPRTSGTFDFLKFFFSNILYFKSPHFSYLNFVSLRFSTFVFYFILFYFIILFLIILGNICLHFASVMTRLILQRINNVCVQSPNDSRRFKKLFKNYLSRRRPRDPQQLAGANIFSFYIFTFKLAGIHSEINQIFPHFPACVRHARALWCTFDYPRLSTRRRARRRVRRARGLHSRRQIATTNVDATLRAQPRSRLAGSL